MLLSACSPNTEIVQHGNIKIQMTQTQNQWADNMVAVTTCEQFENGFCPKDAPTQIVIMSGKMPGIVGAGLTSAAMVGSSFVIRDGLKGSKSNVTQKNSNRNDVRASTVNPK
jgi:hypothetical protein